MPPMVSCAMSKTPRVAINIALLDMPLHNPLPRTKRTTVEMNSHRSPRGYESCLIRGWNAALKEEPEQSLRAELGSLCDKRTPYLVKKYIFTV